MKNVSAALGQEDGEQWGNESESKAAREGRVRQLEENVAQYTSRKV